MGAWRVALPYLVLGTVWILVSDWALMSLTSGGPGVGQMAKGLLFVVLSAGLIYVLSARQLREKWITEREREQLERRLSAAARFEAMGQLSGGIAHDFNNLLTVISGNIESYMNHDPERGRRSPELRDAHDAVHRATALTRQLLAFGRAQVARPDHGDVNEVVRGMVTMLDRLIGDRIRIKTSLGHHLPPARVDPGRLEQVVMNLAINARDAMPDGGELRLTTEQVTIGMRNGGSVPSHLLPGPYIRLTVADTGVGMSTEVQSRIFEPFFTTKGQEQGTGLGLATVHSIVTAWGGDISVRSAPGEGTTFTILLPAARDEPPRPAPVGGAAVVAMPGVAAVSEVSPVPDTADLPDAPIAAEQAVAPNATVLVVDDDAAVRKIVVRVLLRHGFAVLEAPGGREALAELRQAAGAVDLLVTDASMPEMSGLRLIEEALVVDPGLRVLLISGHPGEEFEGATPYLAKPFTSTELVRHVREVLGGH